ncbi:hypothetical protein CC2G_014307 [Coprinopsis cinerea AmutBmut pab1-1]|nr:hypothetical protein CC2G_014307 [Coprinopsis cinerea AmutBmut pab1-1]
MSSQPTGFYMNAAPTGQTLQSEKQANTAFADSPRQHTAPPRTPSRSNRSRTLAVTFRLSDGCPHSEPLDLHFSIALPSSPDCLHPEAFRESCQPAASPTKSIPALVSSPAILRQRPASVTPSCSMAINCGTTSREARPGRSGIIARDSLSSPSPPPSSCRVGGPSHGLQPIVPLPSDAVSNSRSMGRSQSRGPGIPLAVPAVSMDKGVTRGVSWKSTELLSVAEEAVGSTKASNALRVASHPRSGPSTRHGGKGVTFVKPSGRKSEGKGNNPGGQVTKQPLVNGGALKPDSAAPKDAIHGSRDEDAASVTEESSDEDDNLSKTPHPRTSIAVQSVQGYRTDLRRAHEKNQNDDDASITENSSDEDDSQFKPAAQPRTFIAERSFQGGRSEASPLKRKQDDDADSVTENSSDENDEVMLQRPKAFTAKRKLQTDGAEITNRMPASGRKRMRTSD